MFKVPEKHRITTGPLASDSSYGNNGAFAIQDNKDTKFFIIASDGEGWEHVSVHCKIWILKNWTPRTPTWNEMCKVKNLFWGEEDTVIQYHPRQSEYVNNHPHVLHMWRPIGVTLPEPPSILVGIKE